MNPGSMVFEEVVFSGGGNPPIDTVYNRVFVGDFGRGTEVGADGADDIYFLDLETSTSYQGWGTIRYGRPDRTSGHLSLLLGFEDGSGPVQPIIGDYDGDGWDDNFWYGRGSQPDAVWYGNPNDTGTRQDAFDAVKHRVTGDYLVAFSGNFGTGTATGATDDLYLFRAQDSLGAGSDQVLFGRDDRSF